MTFLVDVQSKCSLLYEVLAMLVTLIYKNKRVDNSINIVVSSSVDGHNEAEFGMSWCAGFGSSFYNSYFEVFSFLITMSIRLLLVD